MQCAKLLLFICLLCVRWNFVSCYSTGPPDTACAGMTPSHGAAPQNVVSPYVVESNVPAAGYSPGTSYTVTIKKVASNSPDFKGFMCQVRKADGSSTDAVGTFETFDTSKAQNLACTSSKGAMTHKNSNSVTQFQGTWKAPSTDMGSLKALCTVVQVRTTYWVQVPSSTFSVAALSTTAAPTDTTTAVVTTTPPATAARTTAAPSTAAPGTAARTTAAAPSTPAPGTAARTTAAAPSTPAPGTAARTTATAPSTAAPSAASPATEFSDKNATDATANATTPTPGTTTKTVAIRESTASPTSAAVELDATRLTVSTLMLFALFVFFNNYYYN